MSGLQCRNRISRARIGGHASVGWGNSAVDDAVVARFRRTPKKGTWRMTTFDVDAVTTHLIGMSRYLADPAIPAFGKERREGRRRELLALIAKEPSWITQLAGNLAITVCVGVLARLRDVSPGSAEAAKVLEVGTPTSATAARLVDLTMRRIQAISSPESETEAARFIAEVSHNPDASDVIIELADIAARLEESQRST